MIIKLKKIIIIVVLMLGLIYLTVSVFQKTDARISKVDVITNDGLSYVSRQKLIDKVTDISQGSWLDVDATSVEKYLYGIKGVDYVLVKKVWPSTLVLYMYDRKPLAYWNNSQILLANMDTISPEIVSTQKELPHIYSSDENNRGYVYDVYEKLNRVAKSNSMGILRLDYEGNQVSILLSDDMKVYLGSSDLETKLRIFFSSYTKVKKYESVKYYDMRYSDGFAVKYK
jgi:cell division protein FtsQ